MKQNNIKKGRTNIIGITGGVGAGKSTVLEHIQDNYKARVIYSDDVANKIKLKGCPAYDSLVELLGNKILGDDKEIDKAKMAAAIFGDKSLLESVNNILHPAVNAFIINIIDEERRRLELDFVFVEAALLIENGYREIVDEMWYVYADESVRRQRLKMSRGYSDEKITKIFKSQMDEQTFREYCDFVIDNSGSPESAIIQIDNKLVGWKR